MIRPSHVLVALLLVLLPFALMRARDARGIPGSRSARMLRTGYCLTGRTATGTRVAPGTIAVDPAVIPLGSRVWVEGYGLGRALDTGGAVRGLHVDVWVASCSRALALTRRGVLVRWWR